MGVTRLINLCFLNRCPLFLSQTENGEDAIENTLGTAANADEKQDDQGGKDTENDSGNSTRT